MRSVAAAILLFAAAKRIPQCEFRLGKLLVNLPERKEREYLQGIAWLQLAEEQKLEAAAEFLKTETSPLTPQQTAWVDRMKPQLVHHP